MNIRRRIGLPRMSFHVMNRGARRARIFGDVEDCELFVDLLGRGCLRYEVKLTSWSLMTNHYHLEPNSEGTPLSRMMHDLDGSYARHFNEKYQANGCLFQSRFKSTSIDSDQGLAYVSRYIHLNPRDMGEDPLSYRWSSCRAFLGLAQVPSWLDPEPVLKQFGEDMASSRAAYRFYLQAARPKARRSPPGEDPMDAFLMDYLGHLDEACQDRWRAVGDPPVAVQLQTFVCWYATRQERIPPRLLMAYFGYESAGAVRSVVSRFARRIAEEPDLAKWVLRVNGHAWRQS